MKYHEIFVCYVQKLNVNIRGQETQICSCCSFRFLRGHPARRREEQRGGEGTTILNFLSLEVTYTSVHIPLVITSYLRPHLVAKGLEIELVMCPCHFLSIRNWVNILEFIELSWEKDASGENDSDLPLCPCLYLPLIPSIRIHEASTLWTTHRHRSLGWRTDWSSDS